jgi:hypothetical protein
VKDEDGACLVLNLFTGLDVSTHRADMHRQLVEDGFGMPSDEYEDTDEIVNQQFSGKVAKNAETGRISIVQFDTKDRCKPSKVKAKVKAKGEVEEAEYSDPFADE